MGIFGEIIHNYHDDTLTFKSWKAYDEIHGDLFPVLAGDLTKGATKDQVS